MISSKLTDKELFYREIYSIVKEIPSGCVTTYGEIARLAGKPQCSRIVGQAMSRAPRELRLPCHRVVNASGRIAPGWPEQRMMLEQEGVVFKKNGCADMKKCLWRLEI